MAAPKDESRRVQGRPAPRASVNTRSEVSDLGRRLRELSDKALASGTKALSYEEVRRLLSEVRG